MSQTKYCQSCGYPMKKDKHGGGSEREGSRSLNYCPMCDTVLL